MNNKETIQSAITGLLNLFRSGNIPEKIAIVTNPKFNVPSSKWSLNNRLIQLLSDTCDSRGILQWKQAERRVKKGAKAIYILAPRIIENYTCDCGTALQNNELQTGICKDCKKEIDPEKISRNVFFKGILG